TGGQEEADSQLADRSPNEIKGKHQQEPEGRVADNQRRNCDQLPMECIDQAGDYRQAVVEHSPQPTPKRQYGCRGHEHAEPFSRDLPIDSQVPQGDENDCVDIQTEFGEAMFKIALLQQDASIAKTQAIAPQN